MNGILVIDKPKGPTSFDVVRKLRSALRLKKVGHTGTLDPMATGVLPICLGEATKISNYILEGHKAYEASILLGVETDTYDAEGQVVSRKNFPGLTREGLELVLEQFRGAIEQVPPMFSAVKVQGRRLYELAREGKEVERQARRVTTFELEVVGFEDALVRVRLRSSKGFFVRSLAHDLGQALGCGAHLVSLRRIMSGPFRLEHSLSLEQALEFASSSDGLSFLTERLVSLNDALAELPAVTVDAYHEAKVLHGVTFEAEGQGLVRLVSTTDRLLAMAEIVEGRVKYRRVMTTGEG